MRFNNFDCSLVTFTNISLYKQLKQQEEMSGILATLNASIHHEMLTPLGNNVQVATELQKQIKDPDHLEMIRIVHVNSKLAQLHANDLLDHRIIQNGQFVPEI